MQRRVDVPSLDAQIVLPHRQPAAAVTASFTFYGLIALGVVGAVLTGVGVLIWRDITGDDE
ncbi:hypothetical protein GCM10007304_17870 [Rhodococcoides trifolii]|uniref:Uncharacterized protein n=1 Tax=Rhodococcoides trifolii TaxID=908250 RepID=A0A917D2C9_9NOCA|nr:hypothetical protein GCM10007304_17870 [Rhodococcus trifolii]